MSRVKIVLLSLLTVFAVSAAASATASAGTTHIYKIEGTPLATTEGIEGDSLTGGLETKIAKTNIVLICQEDIVTGKIEKEGKSAAEIKFKNCYLVEKNKEGKKTFLTACSLAEPVKAEATDELTEHSLDTFTGSGAKEKFAELEIKGEGCVLNGKYEVTGSQVCAIPESEFEKAVHVLICTPAGSKLVFAKEPAQLFGEEQVKLTSGKNFSGT